MAGRVMPEAGARRLALLVATSTYDDAGLAQLVSPAQDAPALAGVLAAPEIGDFAVSSLLDATSGEISAAIENFTADRDRADLVVLYLSCHGLKDEQGRLYFAARNTRRDRLRSTAVPSTFVNDVLFACRSRRKVLLLDCCYSGAFAKGLTVKADPSIHTVDHFDARGLVVLTASDATQYAFEGDALTGSASPSAWTASITEGLRTGAGDVDRDGLVSVDDIYEYTRRQLGELPTAQNPRKWEFDVAGTIVLARSPATAGPAGSTPPGGPPPNPPTVLPALVRPVLPTVPPASAVGAVAVQPRPEATSRVRQARWWLAAMLYLAASVGACLLLAAWTLDVIYRYAPPDYIPSRGNAFVAAACGGAAWATVGAVESSGQGQPARWDDVFRRWATRLTTLLVPRGAAQLLQAVRDTVPVNVELTLVLSLAAAALAYAVAGGSEGRESAFPVVFTALTLLGIAGRLRART